MLGQPSATSTASWATVQERCRHSDVWRSYTRQGRESGLVTLFDAGLLVFPMTMTLKEKKPGQRACDVKSEKGELCCGHLKRWYTADEETLKQVGKDVELYRCERCHTLYRPVPEDHSSAGLNYEVRPVNMFGAFVRKVRRK